MNSYANHSMKRHVNLRCSNYFKLNPSGDAFEIFGISLISSVAKPGKLVQLERLHSEDTPRRPMITLTIDQFIFNLKSKQHKVNVKNLKNLPKLQVYDFWKKTFVRYTHSLKLLDSMCKYEMDQASSVHDTERTRFCPQTDRRTDG